MATFDMKSMTLVTDASGLSGSSVLFGAAGGQSAGSPDPIDIDAAAAYILNAVNQGTTKAGLRLNNLTTTQQNALASPPAGSLIYNTTLGALSLYNGSVWGAVGGGITVGSSTITGGTTTRILYDNAGVLGEYTLAGSGTVVAMATAPTFVTSITTPKVLATADDSGALGASGTAFSDLFLASGGVINWNANDVSLTHSSGILTLKGTFKGLTDSGLFSDPTVQMGSFKSIGFAAIAGASGHIFLYNAANTGVGYCIASDYCISWTSTGGNTQPDAGTFQGGVDLKLTRGGAGILGINQTPTAVGTGTKTISNGADSSTNFGHYFSLKLNGTTYFIPCSATAPT